MGMRLSVTNTAQGNRPSRPTESGALGTLEAMGTPLSVERNRMLVIEGDPADALYLVAYGTFRIFKLLDDGRRQIVGFLEAGDILGSVLQGHHAYSAEAVVPSCVLRVSRAHLDSAMGDDVELQSFILGHAAQELDRALEHMLLLGRQSASERLWTFLRRLGSRNQRRGLAAHMIHLPMSRLDIADHLGLTIETVSRTLSQMRANGTIEILDRHRVRLNRTALDARTTA